MALFRRHQLGVTPVGDVDVLARQHPLDRAPQQRGEMARHRGHDQHFRCAARSADAAEVLQLAEGLAEDPFLLDGIDLAADHHARETESVLASEFRRPSCRDSMWPYV